MSWVHTGRSRSRSGRRLLTSARDVREAVIDVAGSAKRQLSIFSHDLEPGIYNHEEFIAVVTRLVLASRFSRVRVLVADPIRAVKDGHEFVTLGRRLSSYIEFRNVLPEYREHHEAFCIADDHAIVFRAQASSWNGIVALRDPLAARKYLTVFNAIWHASDVEREFRRLHV